MNIMRTLCRLNVLAFLFLALVLGGLSVASACNVPVFRYALERWRADPYRLVLVHRGPLDTDEQKLVTVVEAQQESPTPAYVFRSVDLEEAEALDAEWVASLGELSLPALVVQYPEKVGIPAPLLKVPFNQAEFTALTQSPARRELIQRLAQGQTAVWLLLESGDQQQDDAAAALLAQELKQLETQLKLPELTEDPADALQVAAPLKIAFSVLRLPRTAAETALVEMLLGSESDLKERRVPLVYPVFGRGRALLPMVGKGITAENTKSYAEFLVGACSCEVKEQNPGFDLLLTVDWNAALAEQGPAVTSEPKAAGPPEVVAIAPGKPIAMVTNEQSVNSSETSSEPNRAALWWFGGITGALVLIGAVLWPLWKRPSQPS